MKPGASLYIFSWVMYIPMLAVTWLWPDFTFAVATITALLTFQMILQRAYFPQYQVILRSCDLKRKFMKKLSGQNIHVAYLSSLRKIHYMHVAFIKNFKPTTSFHASVFSSFFPKWTLQWFEMVPLWFSVYVGRFNEQMY